MADNYTMEQIRLLANEHMLASRGFMLFAVDQTGALITCGDTRQLNAAERWGLAAYYKAWNGFEKNYDEDQPWKDNV